jgi:ATP-dependent helicase HrpB
MLPIHEIQSAIIKSLREGNRLVLTAPTGSGKTTQVPQFLLALNPSAQILILQPRRLAARMVAGRVAAEMNTSLGQLVGYQTRHDSRIGPATLVRFLTEGLFLRLLQTNPKLTGVQTVILDEFHERNLATDTALALVKTLQESTRPDLRLVVMSATLDAKAVAAYLQCPILEAHGRAYPVDISYLNRRPVQTPIPGKFQSRAAIPPWDLAGDALADLLDREPDGDVLIFMPGAYEIRRTIEVCQHLSTPTAPLALFPLYSELPAAEQDAALSPSQIRKVIVSTNVAETSITIPGIRHVIDSGLARVNRFDPRRGLNVLMVEPISLASADQRAGRAGRTAPGTCHRLWVESDNKSRPPHATPEIQRLDLAETLLQLLSFGVKDLASFPWLQPPDPVAVDQAAKVLRLIDAIDDARQLTPLGARMSRLPLHPRLSRMLIEAQERDCLDRACLWAALISERDILIKGQTSPFADELPDTFPQSDFLPLEAAFAYAQSVHFDPHRCQSKGIHANSARELDKTRLLYRDAFPAPHRHPPSSILHPPSSLASLAKSLLLAFPDHLAIRRNTTNLAAALVDNRRGELDPGTLARHAGPLLPIEIREVATGGSVKTILSLVTELDPDWLKEVHPDWLSTDTVTLFSPATNAVEATRRTLFRDLVLDEKLLPDDQVNRNLSAQLLAGQVISKTLKLENWEHAVEQWIARAQCVAQWFPERNLLAYAPDDIHLIIEEICANAIRYKDIKDRPCLEAVKNAMSWEDQRFVEHMAPDRLELPRGWRMKIEYNPGSPPRGRAKIQDFYGLTETPRIAGGRVKLLLEILGPNMRPVQVTDDLANFWQNLYPTLKKELSRKYPRHEWR